MNRIIIIVLCLFGIMPVYPQSEQNYSAVNPALFAYKEEDVYVRPLTKFNNGRNIIKPNPAAFPWEARLENAMPNVIKDENGNISIYISSFIVYSPSPPSKVGAMVFTNSTNNVQTWTRPNAGLYWYNPLGKTADEKISDEYMSGYKATNIVAVDIESLGIYDDYEITNKPIKLIYLPQRESGNKLLAGYEMDRSFTNNGVLQGFSTMKFDRRQKQKIYTFKFINGDTHMNYLKQKGIYYFVSRLNAKRSVLKTGETLPLTPDNRKRYRRETLTELGPQLTSKNVDFGIALDMSTLQWEPYSMQPFRSPGFEKDIWWGLVTMFGTEGDQQVQHKQRTELAISNDGIHWRYVKAGVPYLDNGTDPQSDDYGCINIAKPVLNTRFSSNPMDAYYFYAASNQRHIEGRNPGISLAIGKKGKIAGLKAEQNQKIFYSMEPGSYHSVAAENMPQFSMYNAFRAEGHFFPYILADVTEDPRGKTIPQLNSYAIVAMFSYDSSATHGVGDYLGGSFGSSIEGTSTISDNYESIGCILGGKDGSDKQILLDYLKKYSRSHPHEVVSIKDFPPFPIILQAWIKNAILYGIKFKKSAKANQASLDLTKASDYRGGDLWSYKPATPSSPCNTIDFGGMVRLPNQELPIEKEMGTIALRVKPASNSNSQTIMRMYGDDSNDIGIYYISGTFYYIMKKDGLEFAKMAISPPSGKTFVGQEVVITLESVKKGDRKYGKSMSEEAAILRVSCPSISFEKTVQQDVLWEWKHAQGGITAADSANARAFAYLDFSAFVPRMTKISVGGRNSNCDNPFSGSIYQVEVAEKLPSGSSDFWDSISTRSSSLPTDIRADDSSNGKKQIKVYPNPCNESLYVQLPDIGDSSVKGKIYDLSGRLILDDYFFIDATNQICIKTMNYPNGIYIIHLSKCDNSWDFHRKIIIKH